MNQFEKDNLSYWSDSVTLPSYPALESDLETEVLVVGAGISGLMNAYQLSQKGYKVTVIEGNKVVSGTTANTTARITAQQGLLYGQLRSQKNDDDARLYYQSQMDAIDEIERIVNAHEIDCDFRRVDAITYAEHDSSVEDLEKEADAYRQLGIDGELQKDGVKLPFSTVAQLVMRNQGEFHPLKFLDGILQVLDENGVEIYEHTRGESIENDTITTTDGHDVSFDKLVIATHFPFLDFEGLYFNSFKIGYGYGLVVTTSTPTDDNVSLNGYDGAALSTRNIVNTDQENPVLLYGGMGHMSYEDKDMEDQLEQLKLAADQKTTNLDRLYAYRAQDLMTADSLPFLGLFDTSHSNRFVATGYNKFGMANSVLSSMIIRDIIEGNENPYRELLDPHRNKGTFAQLKQHLMNPLHITEAETKSMIKNNEDIEDITLEVGEGAVVKDGPLKKGIYRDESQYYVTDNRCTHMGCSLGWNEYEKTWDCPCHGSRFKYDGTVVEGPAVDDLEVEIRKSKE